MSLSLLACFDFTVPTVNKVDIPAYIGKWYQIAAHPTNFNGSIVAVTAEYTLQKNGTVAVYNCALKNNFEGSIDEIYGTASIVDSCTNSKLNVFFPNIFNAPIPGGNYWIMVLDEVDYSYSAVPETLGVTLFILSRTLTMDEGLYQSILFDLESNGVKNNKLKLTPQPLIDGSPL